jgi:hypothetical protein
MFHDFFAGSPHLAFPIVGLIFFLAAFAAVLGHVCFGLRRSRDVDPLAALPFEDGEPEPRSGGRARS